jgi:hypothetical protein
VGDGVRLAVGFGVAGARVGVGIGVCVGAPIARSNGFRVSGTVVGVGAVPNLKHIGGASGSSHGRGIGGFDRRSSIPFSAFCTRFGVGVGKNGNDGIEGILGMPRRPPIGELPTIISTGHAQQDRSTSGTISQANLPSIVPILPRMSNIFHLVPVDVVQTPAGLIWFFDSIDKGLEKRQFLYLLSSSLADI